jgi:hypothetical protein
MLKHIKAKSKIEASLQVYRESRSALGLHKSEFSVHYRKERSWCIRNRGVH